MGILADFARRMCSKRVTKWAGVFTLLACCFACVGLAQDTKESAADSPAKTPGELLIDFMMNPPDKYDIGVARVKNDPRRDSTTYFRIKRDGDFCLFSARSPHFSILNNETVGELELYDSILSKYADEYWKCGASSLTTWTNKHRSSVEGTPFMKPLTTEKVIMKEIIKILPYFPKKPFKEEQSFFQIEGEPGSTNSIEGIITLDRLHRIVRLDVTYATPRNRFSSKNDENIPLLLGSIYEYRYTTNLSVSFFPNEIYFFDIYKLSGDEQLFTNEVCNFLFSFINLNPEYNRENFSIEPKPDSKIKKYWVSGTNTMYVDEFTGVLEKLQTESEWEKEQAKKKYLQNSLRYIYIFLLLAICAFVGYFVFKNKNT